MANRARLGLYLKDEEVKKRIKVAAAKRGMTVTAYCAQAIEEHLMRDDEGKAKDVDRNNLLSRMDKLRQEIGPVGVTSAELVEALLSKVEDLEDMLAMKESLSTPEDEAMNLEDYEHKRAACV